jgi:hypothetical protein
MQNKYFLKGHFTSSFNIRLEMSSSLNRVFGPWQTEDLLVEVSLLKSKRSDKQNRYLHAVIVPCIQNWHYETQGTKISSDEAKAYIYTSVLKHKVVITEILGQEVITMQGKHFSEMNTVEFNEAKTEVQEFFAPLGCDIPDPRENNLNTDFL